MNERSAIPPFPAGLEDLLVPGAVEVLTTLELGAAWRLLRASWAVGCMLPADEAAVAALAGLRAQEWDGAKERLVWALAIEWDGERSGATCTRAAAVQARLGTDAAALSAKRAAAARSRWGQRPSQPTATDASAMQLHRGGASAVQLHRSSASALERSAQNTLEQERSSAAGQDVVGVIHDAIDATASARITAWRVAMSLEQLRAAAKGWEDGGRLANDADDQATLVRIANDPKVTPALVQIALQRAQAADAANPLGYVIHSLGLKRGARGGLTPYLTDQGIVDRWARLEAKQVDAERAKAAVTGVVARFQPAPPLPRVEIRKHGGAS